MQTDTSYDAGVRTSWLDIHPPDQDDLARVAALREAVAPIKGRIDGIAGRAGYDELMEGVVGTKSVTFEAATVGGIPGWWARPAESRNDSAILHLHGGWFNRGSARAYRNFVGYIALVAATDAFIPEYRLAPESPFPAAVEDTEACYWGLLSAGKEKIALSGDSAGGNLALVLLSNLCATARKGGIVPVGAVVFSPVTDLTLSGKSYDSQAEVEPFFTKPQIAELVRSYLGDADPKDPLASPLFGSLSGLPPLRIVVGDAEVLLDDSFRYANRATAAGVDARLSIWMGMPHGFVTGIGKYTAASRALRAVGEFLSERLRSAGK